MFPTLNRSKSAPLPTSHGVLRSKQKDLNPMGLALANGDKKSPPPSPNSGHQHISQMVPSQPVVLQNAKIVNPKRIQLIQLQIKPDETKIANSQQNLKAKVDAVFDAFALVHKENMVDNRKGTVPVYTLPEFFWSDFNSTLTPDQQQTLIQDIKDRAKGEEFEGAVFVLGSMVSSEPPKSMAAIGRQDLQKIQEQLGDLSQITNQDAIDFTQTYNEAMGPGIENCGTDKLEARALLATVGDMMGDRLIKAGMEPDTPIDAMNQNFDRDEVMGDILKDVKTMSQNRSALSIMSTSNKVPNKTNMDKFNQFMADKKYDKAKNIALKYLKPGLKKHQLDKTRLKELATLFKEVGSNKAKLSGLVNDFRTFYYPKSASNIERTRYNKVIVGNKNVLPQLKDPATMYKLTRNQSMVIEGGADPKVSFVQKMLPSLADSPSYFVNRSESHLVPHKLQSASILAIPTQESEDIGQQINDHDFTPDDFKFESPKTGITLGVAICRDYNGGVYKEHFDPGLHDQIDHLQIVASGVTKIDERMGRAKTSIGLNDGQSGHAQFATKDDFPNNNADQLRSDIVEYDPNDQTFSFLSRSRNFDKKPMTLEDKSFSMGISHPAHLEDHDASSIGSFKDDTNKGTIQFMQKLVDDHQTSISVYRETIADAKPLRDKLEPIAVEINAINQAFANDKFEKSEFEKHHKGEQYVSPLDYDKLNEKLAKLHDLAAPWIDQVNSDPLLLVNNDGKKYGPDQGSTIFGMLRDRIVLLESKIQSSIEIVEFNQMSINRITVDRLRAQQFLPI